MKTMLRYGLLVLVAGVFGNMMLADMVTAQRGSSEGEVASGAFTVYYNNPNNWTTVNTYYFKSTDGADNNGWPGQAMTAPPSGSQWYSFQVPDGYDRIIFNSFVDGSGEQTANLERSTTGWFDGTTWLDSEPAPPPAAGDRDITFQVNMSVMQSRGIFDPASHQVYVRGSFNDWGTGNPLTLTDATNQIYSATVTVNGSEGSQIQYKFFHTGGEGASWESDPNRTLTLGPNDTPQTAPLVFFDNIENFRNVVFQVNMSVAEANGNFNPSNQNVYARGGFNGWGTTAMTLTDATNKIYSATLEIGGAEGTSFEYKFFYGTDGNTGTYESRNNRSFTLGPGGVTQNLPVVFFNDDETILTTRSITFNVDMRWELELGNYTAGNPLYVRGSFNDWGTTVEMDAQFVGSTIYTATTNVTAAPGATIEYKFTNGGTYEELRGGGNRSFVLGTDADTRPTVDFNDGARLEFTVTGGPGWRFMSSPFTDVSYLQLFNALHTQGFAGAAFAGGNPAVSNLRTLANGSTTGNPATQSYVSIDDGNGTPSAGSGFAFGVFADDTPQPETPGQFPKTRLSTGIPNTGDIEVGGLLNPHGEFTLVGNPYFRPIDFAATTRSGLSDVIYIYDPAVGGFLDWNGSAGSHGSYIVAPFQGFLIHANSPSMGLTFTEASRTTGGSFRGKEQSDSDAQPLVFGLRLEGEGVTSTAWVHFSEEAEAGLDSRDGFRLYPFTSKYALLKTFASDGTGLSINHYPAPGEPVVIPMDITSTVSGSFSLTAPRWDLPADWSVMLHDTWSGQAYDLDAHTEVSLELDRNVSPGKVRGDGFAPDSPAIAMLEGTPRFSLVVRPGQVTSIDAPETLPLEFTLEQNYPNPFNPGTVIAWQLPSESTVRLAVYDLLGRQVAVLVDDVRPAGRYTVNFDASALGSGVYVYRLEAAGFVQTRKMTLVK
jgi:hypothetical protein